MESKGNTIIKYEYEEVFFNETEEFRAELYRELSFAYWHEVLDVRDNIFIDLNKQTQGGIQR